MMRRLLTARTERDWAEVTTFFAPDVPDPAMLRSLGTGLTAVPAVADADVLILRRGEVSRRLFERNPSLQLVQRLGARTDGIDLHAAHEYGVEVACLPRPSLVCTAEHTMLLMLALVKRLSAAERAMRTGAGSDRPAGAVAYNWAGVAGIGGLAGRTLGVVGLGEVGGLVAARARAFGMRVLYCGRRRLAAEREVELGAEYRPIAELLGEADIVALHAPGVTVGEPVIGAAEIAAMRPGALLVNTSRGWLVAEDALYDALRAGRLGGAGLDVHRTEPRPAGDRFCALNNVVLTPHIAGGSRLEVIDEVARMIDNVRSVRSGGIPIHGRVVANHDED
ncbi:MAG: 2-hydroxyacid dehydrogenase [Thermocrispum sp.]